MPTDDTATEAPRIRGLSSVWWVLGILVMCYVLLFGLVFFDEFFCDRRFIQDPLRTYAPDFSDRFRESFQFIYWPVIQLLRSTKIIPP